MSTKALLLTLLLAALPLLLGYYVNRTAPHAPTRAYRATYCTRHCALHGCRHATRANSPAYFRLRPLYAATIRGLAAGGRGWYEAVNIGFYIVLIPSLLLWLAYGALRNAGTIHKLKRQRL